MKNPNDGYTEVENMADKLREDLAKIIPDRDRLITENIGEEYTRYAHGSLQGTADAVIFPTSTEEVSRIMRYAWNHHIPVTPRGANTNLTGSTVPLEGGIVLILTKMNHILEIDEETMTVTVEPGVLLKDLQQYVEARGLFYPPDPGEKNSTIGGNISTNAGGMRAVRYGVTRDFVRSLEVVFADGEVTTIGTKTVKDATGLSLKNLIIGSEGTLAVITRCVLKLIPKPETTVNAIAAFAEQRDPNLPCEYTADGAGIRRAQRRKDRRKIYRHPVSVSRSRRLYSDDLRRRCGGGCQEREEDRRTRACQRRLWLQRARSGAGGSCMESARRSLHGG